MIAYLKKIYGRYLHRKSLKEEFEYYNALSKKYQTADNYERLEYIIKVQTHGIEKGLSFRTPKEAFGVPKILVLINNIKQYIQYQKLNRETVNESLNVISTYINKFKGNSKIADIENGMNEILQNFGKIEECQAGTITIDKKLIDKAIDIDYPSFVKARHSYRYFTKDVNIEQIKEALEIARYTPTACNRQPQNVHIYKGNEMEQVLTIQHGALGFINEMSYCILITADMRAYSKVELYQAYVDGGLYAMNLLNALHSTGLGTIPLTCGHLQGTGRKQLATFGIEEYECPILIIGIGGREESAKVNVSPRKDYNEYTKFH